MLGVECEPPVSEIRHDIPLRLRSARTDRPRSHRPNRGFESFNTTSPRSRSKQADRPIFSKRSERAATYDQPTPGKERKMLRVILVATLLCASRTAFSQELTAEQRSACMGDYEKFCKGTTPGGGRIIACLSKSSDSSRRPAGRFWRTPKRNELEPITNLCAGAPAAQRLVWP